MIIKNIFFICALIIFTSQTSITHAEGELLRRPEGTVAFCIDGDTIKLTDRRIIKLAGIDAPDLAKNKNNPQYYAKEAREYLESIVKGKKVLLYVSGVSDKDSYGRIIADVRIENGESLSEMMVENGAAYYYPHQDQSPNFQNRLFAAQDSAIKAKAGFWDHILSLPIAQQQYTGNRSNLRFYPANCSAIRNILPRNRVYFGTLMDAFLAGFSPAKECSFWPTVQK